MIIIIIIIIFVIIIIIIFIIIVAIIIIGIIIDHVCYKRWLGRESIFIVFEQHHFLGTVACLL